MRATKHRSVRYGLMAVMVLALSGLGFYAVRQFIRGNASTFKGEAKGSV
jgi:hypothetical protein